MAGVTDITTGGSGEGEGADGSGRRERGEPRATSGVVGDAEVGIGGNGRIFLTGTR